MSFDAEVEAVPREAGEVGEAELALHAVDVHVGETGDGVVTTGADLVEAGRAGRRWIAGLIEAGERTARTHRDVGELALAQPCLAPVDFDDPRRTLSRYRAGTRSTHRSGGSMRWSSAENSWVPAGSVVVPPTI